MWEGQTVDVVDCHGEKIIFDSCLHDFYDLCEEIVKITALFLFLKEKKMQNKEDQIFPDEKEKNLWNEIREFDEPFLMHSK